MDDLQISDEQVLERLRPVKMGRKKNKRLAFKPEWVKLPVRWVEVLRRSKSASTYQLALTISLARMGKEP